MLNPTQKNCGDLDQMAKGIQPRIRRGKSNAARHARPAPPAPSAQRRRTPEEAKQEIIEVARGYLSRNRFRDLTVDKLMRQTQIGRSAFYVYFKDVYDLAEIFIHELAGQIESGAADWLDRDGPPIERVRLALKNAVSFWETNGGMIRALEEATTQDERLQRIWRDEVSMRPVRRVAEAIRRDQAAGLIGPLDAQEMSLALNRFNMTYLNDCFGSGRKRNSRVVLETLERVWISSLYGGASPPTNR